MQNRLASVAKTKTKAKRIQHDLGVAAAELHLSNKVLAEAAAGSADASVKDAVAQILEVEKHLHAAVAELARITALLRDAEAEGGPAGEVAVLSPVKKRPSK